MKIRWTRKDTAYLLAATAFIVFFILASDSGAPSIETFDEMWGRQPGFG